MQVDAGWKDYCVCVCVCVLRILWREQVQRPVFMLFAPSGLHVMELLPDPVAKRTLQETRSHINVINTNNKTTFSVNISEPTIGVTFAFGEMFITVVTVMSATVKAKCVKSHPVKNSKFVLQI